MDSEWRYRLLGEEFGPLRLDALRELVHNGTLGLTDEVCEGEGAWRAVAEVLELQALPELADESASAPAAAPPLDEGLASLLNSVADQASAAAPGTAARTTKTDDWYCQTGDIELGPLPFDQLVELAASGQIGRGDRVRRGAEQPWQLATEIVGLVPDDVADAAASGEIGAGSDPGATSAEWYYEREGHTLGPVGLETLKLLADSGQLSPRDRVREGQGGRWLRAMTLPGLFTNLLAARSIAGQAEQAARARSAEEQDVAPEQSNLEVTADATESPDEAQSDASAAVEDAPPAASKPDRWDAFFAQAEARDLKRRGKPAATASAPANSPTVSMEVARPTPHTAPPAPVSMASAPPAPEPPRPPMPVAPPPPVMASKPAPRASRSPRVDFSGLGGSLRNVLSGIGNPRVWGVLAAIAVLAGLKFAPGLMAGQPGDVDYEPLASLWKRGLQLREQKADAAAWQSLAAEATPVLDEMQARLAPVVKSRGREVPIAQRILWMVDIPGGPTGASGHLRKLLESGTGTPEDAVKLGTDIMKETRRLLPPR